MKTVTMAVILLVVSFFVNTPGAFGQTLSDAAGSVRSETSPDGNGAILLAANEENEETDFDDLDWADEDFGTDMEDTGTVRIADPLIVWNRAMFHFNDRLYFWVLKPVASGYKAITPTPVRSGVSNFFYNLTAPVRIVSCLLQGKGQATAGELARFMLNSTFGLIGILDMTGDDPALNPKEEDLGQVLGTWGIGHGCYIVWPVLASSSLRDTIGMAGGRFLNPTSYVTPALASIGVNAVETVNKTSFRIGDYESLKDAAIIPYEAFRDGYVQYREKAVAE